MRFAAVLVCLALFGACMPASNENAVHPAIEAYQRGEWARSIALLDEYLRDNPKDTVAWIVLGHAREELGQDAEAVAAYQKALALYGKSAPALTRLGVLAQKRGEYTRAMALYRRAVEFDPTYAEAYASMAVVSVELAQDAQAVDYAEKAWRLDPTGGECAATLAIAYHYAGRPKERDELKAQARRLGSRNVDVLEKVISGEITLRD